MSVDVAGFAAGGRAIVSGDWSPGKTTLLRALTFSAVLPSERVVTVVAAPLSAGGSTCSTPRGDG